MDTATIQACRDALHRMAHEVPGTWPRIETFMRAVAALHDPIWDMAAEVEKGEPPGGVDYTFNLFFDYSPCTCTIVIGAYWYMSADLTIHVDRQGEPYLYSKRLIPWQEDLEPLDKLALNKALKLARKNFDKAMQDIRRLAEEL